MELLAEGGAPPPTPEEEEGIDGGAATGGASNMAPASPDIAPTGCPTFSYRGAPNSPLEATGNDWCCGCCEGGGGGPGGYPYGGSGPA